MYIKANLPPLRPTNAILAKFTEPLCCHRALYADFLEKNEWKHSNPIFIRDLRNFEEAIASVNKAAEVYGESRLAFVTLTFSRRTSVENANEAFKRSQSALRKLFPDGWFKVVEFNKKGGIHFHMIAVCSEDIRAGFNFEAYSQMQEFNQLTRPLTSEKKTLRGTLGRQLTSNPALKGLWKQLEEVLPKHGFGRCEVAPLRECPEAAAKYLIGGWADSIRRKKAAGVKPRTRLYSYAKPFPRVKLPDGPGKEIYRRKVEIILEAMHLSREDMTERYGPRWNYLLMRHVMDHLDYFLHSNPEEWDRARVAEFTQDLLHRFGTHDYSEDPELEMFDDEFSKSKEAA